MKILLSGPTIQDLRLLDLMVTRYLFNALLDVSGKSEKYVADQLLVERGVLRRWRTGSRGMSQQFQDLLQCIFDTDRSFSFLRRWVRVRIDAEQLSEARIVEVLKRECSYVANISVRGQTTLSEAQLNDAIWANAFLGLEVVK